jgi:tetratricopeptide (TPR) repeat protein
MSGTFSQSPTTPEPAVPSPGKSIPKFGFKRVTRRKQARMEAEGQLNLFDPPDGGNAVGFKNRRPNNVVRFPTAITPFEDALRLDERGDEAAADRYWKAITIGDSVADAYCNLGVIEYRRGRVSKAFNCFTNSLESDPRHFEAHYNVANLYFETGELRLAKLHYEIAAEVRPDDAKLYFNLGLVYAMSEDFKAAIAALSNYKERAPEIDDAHADELIDILRRTIVNPE